MAVLIQNRQEKHEICLKTVRKKAQTILSALGSPDSELSIVITDDADIAELNETYLNHIGPTNVISFPMQEGEFSGVSPLLLGDVVISADTALKEGEEAGTGLEYRFYELLIHGILHLFGYDHELSDEEYDRMEAKQNELLEVLKKADEK